MEQRIAQDRYDSVRIFLNYTDIGYCPYSWFFVVSVVSLGQDKTWK